MMFLLSLLALAAPIDDTAYACRIELKDRQAGSLLAGQVFPQDDQGDHSVGHVWKWRRGRVEAFAMWRSPALGGPGDDDRVTLTLHDIPKGVDGAGLQLWQGGKRAFAGGHAISLRGVGYRDIYVELPVGTLRQLVAAGPVMLMAIDESGEIADQLPLPAALLDQPGIMADRMRGDFDAMTADPAKRCPIYEPTTEIVVT